MILFHSKKVKQICVRLLLDCTMDTFRGNMLRSYLTSYIYLTTKRHTSCRLSQDTMPPKKVSRAKGTNKEEDSYSYITDEEDEHVAAASSTPAPAAAPPSAVTGSEPPAGPPGVGAAFTRTVQRGPPCATSKAKMRIPSPSTSSDDPGSRVASPGAPQSRAAKGSFLVC